MGMPMQQVALPHPNDPWHTLFDQIGSLLGWKTLAVFALIGAVVAGKMAYHKWFPK